MQLLDWIVIALFFVALIGIIVWVVRQKQNNAADYFLGGKDVRSTSSVLPARALRQAWRWPTGKSRAG